MNDNRQIWFVGVPGRRFGFVPVTREGWIVLVALLGGIVVYAAIASIVQFLVPELSWLGFAIFFACLAGDLLALFLIVRAKSDFSMTANEFRARQGSRA